VCRLNLQPTTDNNNNNSNNNNNNGGEGDANVGSTTADNNDEMTDAAD
jgi:hypothetical protein